MNRRAPILIAGSILTLDMSLARPAAAEPALQPVYLVVSNQAGVPPEVMSGAVAEVARVYQAIGVEVIWTRDTSNTGGHCFFVNIVPERMGHPSSTSTLGFALRGGTLAYVVFERVERFAVAWGNNLTTTLGLTLAHELGHLLLRNGTHAVSGLMSSTWSPADAGRVASGRLLFGPVEASRIRKVLECRP